MAAAAGRGSRRASVMRTTTDKTSCAGRPWIPPLRCPPFPVLLQFALCCHTLPLLLLSLLLPLRLLPVHSPCSAFSAQHLATLCALQVQQMLCRSGKRGRLHDNAGKSFETEGRAVQGSVRLCPMLAARPGHNTRCVASGSCYGCLGAGWLAGEAGNACEHSWLPSCMGGWQAGCRCFTPAWA